MLRDCSWGKMMAATKMKKHNRKRRSRSASRGLQGLKQKLAQGPFGNYKYIENPDGAEKMSEVLRRFVEPYAGAANTKEAYGKLLTLALTAWNAALMPEAERPAMLEQVLDKGLTSVPVSLRKELRAFVDELIARKLKYFADNRRMIIDFTIEETPTSFHLAVVSTLLSPST